MEGTAVHRAKKEGEGRDGYFQYLPTGNRELPKISSRKVTPKVNI